MTGCDAARGVSDKVRDAHPEVPWRVITDMRNRVTHGYLDIACRCVWQAVPGGDAGCADLVRLAGGG
jgi:uncharacterized protein with HEPN domain